MLGDLPADVIGTNPKYPSIVNHDWLTVDSKTYDNYPSDNNSVRVLPKLSALWNHEGSTGINLVPNLTIQSSKNAETKSVEEEIVREGKKAMMAGLSGKDLADHLRSRFSASHLKAASEGIKKLSEEQGLLGNVYIDASAFVSGKEMEQFLTQHRTRLAQDIVVNESKLNPSVISVLASKFHKNVVAKVSYDEKLFQKYAVHLITAGQIDKSYVINSKETLRTAFLAKPEKKEAYHQVVPEQRVASDKVIQEMAQQTAHVSSFHKMAQEELLFRKIRPILECAREQLVAHGKTGSDLKEILRKKYAADDLRDSAKYLALVVSDKMSSEYIDSLVTAEKIPEFAGDILKKLSKTYPKKVDIFEEKEKSEKTVGVQGYYHSLSGKKDVDQYPEHKEAAINDLKRGLKPEEIRSNLLKANLSVEDANKVLAGAVNEINALSAGSISPEKVPVEQTIMKMVQGYVQGLLENRGVSKEHKEAAISDLKKGLKPEDIRSGLLKANLSIEDANKVLAGALSEMNALPAGAKANVQVKAPKEKVVADPEEKQQTPSDPDITGSEIQGIFAGSNDKIDIDVPSRYSSIEIEGMFNRSGIDSVL